MTSDLLDYSSKLDVKMTGWISNALFPLVDSLVRLFRDIIKVFKNVIFLVAVQCSQKYGINIKTKTGQGLF